MEAIIGNWNYLCPYWNSTDCSDLSQIKPSYDHNLPNQEALSPRTSHLELCYRELVNNTHLSECCDIFRPMLLTKDESDYYLNRLKCLSESNSEISLKPEPSCPNELSNSESDEEVLYSPKVFGTCALNCSYSLFIQDQSKIEKVHLYLNNASITFITAAVISLSIYILTFQQKRRKLLRECSIILLVAFLIFGISINLVLRYDMHCSQSLLCPLSSILISFSFLSISALYLFFTSNIVLELKSFFSSISLHPREYDPLPLHWLHWFAWIFVLCISTIITVAAAFHSNIRPFPLFKVCLFHSRWPYMVIGLLHLLFLFVSIISVSYSIWLVSNLLPVINHFSSEGKRNVQLYTARIASLLVCLVLLLSTSLAVFIKFNRTDFEKIVCQNTRNFIFPDRHESECETAEWDLDCLVYMLYTLEFCVFIQAIWPLDATFFIFLISCFNRSSKANENRDEELRLEQIPKFFREKNENLKDSIILRKTRASDESRKESDLSSTLGEWLATNRLISRRHAALPARLLPDLVRSRTPEIKDRRKKPRKMKKTEWSIKQGFTNHHQRIINNLSESSDEEEVANFYNFSISNEARLSAAIAKIDQFGFSTTQSERSENEGRPGSSKYAWSSIMPGLDQSASLLDNIRLSDLTSDEEYDK